MFDQTLHHRRLRLLASLGGCFLMALSLNLFLVPLHLYASGMLGFCQLLRTLLQMGLGLDFGTYDVAGILYFLGNLPLLFLGWQFLGRAMMGKTILCTIAYSFFYSVLPTPDAPIIADDLTACLLGGLLSGVGSGIILTCGSSTGGLDIVALCLSQRNRNMTVGKFSLFFNTVLYLICLVLFQPEIAIYSVIYNFFSSLIMDRRHQQNITVQALIFTRDNQGKLARFIMEHLHRGVTSWNGVGGYTGEPITVLCVCLSKYEVQELFPIVRAIDPSAFLTVQEGTRVHGNFSRNLS